MTELERRYSSASPELRADGSDNRIAGYAAMFNKRSHDLGGFIEFVGPHAFDESLNSGANILCRFEHENVGLLGTTDAGTLSVWTDETGLAYDCLPPCASPVLELVKRGDVRKSSFAFRTVADEWSRDVGGMPTRMLHVVELVDVAPVTVPAYEDTSVRGVVESLARKFGEDPEEIRSLLENRQVVKLFKNSATKREAKPVTLDKNAELRKKLYAKRFDPYYKPEDDDVRGKFELPPAWNTESWHKAVNTEIKQREEDEARGRNTFVIDTRIPFQGSQAARPLPPTD